MNKEKAGNILRWTKKNTKQNWTSDFMAFYEDTWCQWNKKKTKDALPYITNKTLCIVSFFCYFIFMDLYFEHIIPKFVKFIQNYTDFVHFISLLLLVYTIWKFSSSFSSIRFTKTYLFNVIFCTHGFRLSLPNFGWFKQSHNIFFLLNLI